MILSSSVVERPTPALGASVRRESAVEFRSADPSLFKATAFGTEIPFIWMVFRISSTVRFSPRSRIFVDFFLCYTVPCASSYYVTNLRSESIFEERFIVGVSPVENKFGAGPFNSSKMSGDPFTSSSGARGILSLTISINKFLFGGPWSSEPLRERASAAPAVSGRPVGSFGPSRSAERKL